MIAFGWGVFVNAECGRRNAEFLGREAETRKRVRGLKIVGLTLIAQGVVGYFWPPMHVRGAEFTLTDSLHIAFAMIVVPLMMLGIWFSSRVVGRVYAFVTLVVVFGFGLLTGLDGPNIAANLPTPWVGVWERIGIAAWVVWVAGLAGRLMRNS